MRIKRSTWLDEKFLPTLILLAFLVLFSTVAWLSVRNIDPQWDELTDHQIASSFLENPLLGIGLDGSQARLPMYLTAVVYGTLNTLSPTTFPDSSAMPIMISRTISILVGTGTITCTYFLGCLLFCRTTGILTAILLSISPYFIGFARMAMTEGDVFSSFGVSLTLLAFMLYIRQRSSRRMMLFTVVLGLALASKFTLVTIIIPLIFCDVLEYQKKGSSFKEKTDIRVQRSWFIWVLFVSILTLGAIITAQLRMVNISIFIWASGLFLFSLIILFTFFPKTYSLLAVFPKCLLVSRLETYWTPTKSWFVSLPMAICTCLLIFPAHLLQPEIARVLFFERLGKWDDSLPLASFKTAAFLQGGIIFIKLGVLFGVLTVISLLYSGIYSYYRSSLRVVFSVIVSYMVFLLTLPVSQSFYLMSVYPLIILVLAAFIVETSLYLSVSSYSIFWKLYLLISILFLINGYIKVYPSFNYFGYETVGGDRWLGFRTMGQRKVIDINLDGYEDALSWCVNNINVNSKLAIVFSSGYLIEHLINENPVDFEIVYIDKQENDVVSKLRDADYVIVHLMDELSNSYREKGIQDELSIWFDPEPIYVVWRGRDAYKMPVVKIYKKKT